MLDGKILAAVLTTLAAVAVSTGQGIGAQDVELDAPERSEYSFSDLLDNPVNNVRSIFTRKPEPENSVTAELRLHSIDQEKISLKNSRISLPMKRSVGLGGKSVETDSGIVLTNFTGDFKISNHTSISGKTLGLNSSGVKIRGSSKINEKLNGSTIDIQGTEKSSVNLEMVNGSISSESSSTQFDNPRNLDINSYSGDIMFYPVNRTILLDGKVSKLEAGGFTFGN